MSDLLRLVRRHTQPQARSLFWSRYALGLAIIVALALCTGCTFTTPQARNAQLALTGLMALDTAQTVTIARSPCLFEANPVAAAVFGSKRPSAQTVLATNAIYIAGHWALGSYLDRKANQPVDLSIDAQADMARRDRWRSLQRIYQIATSLGHGYAVARNARKAIAPFSSFDCE